MKKLILLSCLCGSMLFAGSCKDLPKDQREACKAEKLNSLKNIESKSHQGRIGILNEAENCNKNAKTKEAYKACEKAEKEKRHSLKSEIRAEKQELKQK